MGLLKEISIGVEEQGGLLGISNSIRDTFRKFRNWQGFGLDYEESEVGKDYGYDWQFGLGTGKFKEESLYGLPKFIWLIIIVVIFIFVSAVVIKKSR